ncbi:YidC/Oxa1 family membrane protein insertase [Streptomyces sp. NPDC004647]|uniref:YidC/Oxa1 family membrane protein insertase n=1 Tax=Streptomyces sp. NPDC004647 TaxID=3154671 RepID=UPI0033A0AFC1
MSVFASLGALLTQIADALDPFFGASATAAAIVLFTLCVRLVLHPLARAAARGEKARAALAPRMAELRRKHKNNPERLQRAMSELYAESGSSPLAGCLPMLLQLPVFFVMYHLFTRSGGGLLDHELLGAPLGGRWADALGDGGVFGAHGLVYVGLFAAIAAVAGWTYVRARRAAASAPAATAPQEAAVPGMPNMAGMAKVLPLLSFGTLITAAVVPLAAGLYLATTTAWTAAERAWLHRDRDRDRDRDGATPAAAALARGKA